MSREKVSKGFTNVIFCEDIREETGNKKSLMGILLGDVFVPNFPATIKVAMFLQYNLGADEAAAVSVEFRIMQDDVEIAKGAMSSPVPDKIAHFLFPQALITFEKEAVFRLCASVNGDPEEEILTKKIAVAPTTNNPSA